METEEECVIGGRIIAEAHGRLPEPSPRVEPDLALPRVFGVFRSAFAFLDHPEGGERLLFLSKSSGLAYEHASGGFGGCPEL
ncbi:hypothetical protein KEG38_31625 [Polyangium jinanense]|uniref:hypothetical protein n=1 Tax=Polyangium jinanense TaxID=2829994 RepID=UPI002340F1D1|nr:hypothetical protein [Polyangium jinanense]MDC3958449.1 hypothetical protein [Polyangium jinanense]